MWGPQKVPRVPHEPVKALSVQEHTATSSCTAWASYCCSTKVYARLQTKLTFTTYILESSLWSLLLIPATGAGRHFLSRFSIAFYKQDIKQEYYEQFMCMRMLFFRKSMPKEYIWRKYHLRLFWFYIYLLVVSMAGTNSTYILCWLMKSVLNTSLKETI